MFSSDFWGNFAISSEYFTWDTLLYVFVALVFFFIAKWNYNKLQPNFNLDEELLETDNKALSVSFLGYILGLGFIFSSVLSSETSYYLADLVTFPLLASLLDLSIWIAIGIALLNVARVINNRFVLRGFSNEKEIIEDKNVGTGAVQLGSYVASAYIIATLLALGGTESFFFDLGQVLLFFLLTQSFLILFSYLYNKTISYDLHKEVERDNESAGIVFGLNLIAMGIIMSFPLQQEGGILFFLFWFVNGFVLLTLARFFLHKVIFNKGDLRHEIVVDNNWGIALIEGSLSVIIAIIINATFG